jgi:hypothetical protein
MQQVRWIATGFVAGLAVAGGVFLLLRDDASRDLEQARVGELKAQVDRLASAVTNLSMLAHDAHTNTTASTTVQANVAVLAPQKPPPAQLQAIADADALVDLGIQSGQWSRDQQDELGAAISDLDVKEQGRILARVSKAMNDGQLKFDPRQR